MSLSKLKKHVSAHNGFDNVAAERLVKTKATKKNNDNKNREDIMARSRQFAVKDAYRFGTQNERDEDYA